jgi:hypothetical protein
VSGRNVGYINRAPPILADRPLSAPADMPPAKWTNIFFNLAFNDAIAAMTPEERQRTLGRLREAIANCPDSLGLTSFWAHMQSCSNNEWRRTMARIDEVGALPARSPSALRSAQAMLCGLGVRSAQIGGFDSTALSTTSFWSHAGRATPAEWDRTVERIGQVGAHSPSAFGSAQAMLRALLWDGARAMLCGLGMCCRAFVRRRSAASTPRR